MKTLKIKKIDFSYCSACGQMSYTTQYFINGKRISAKKYLHYYGDPVEQGYEWTNQEIWNDTNKNGIVRHHILNTFTKKEEVV